MAEETKEVQTLARPTNCMKCNKRLQRKSWYYRNGGYYCSKRCWKEADIKKREEEQKKREDKIKKEEEQQKKQTESREKQNSGSAEDHGTGTPQA